MTTETLSQVQAAARLLADIADDIYRIKSVLNEDEDAVSNTTVTAIEALGRLGWLADCGARRLGENVTMVGADPMDWMATNRMRETLAALGPQ